jgi:hypothetical protein
MDCITPIPQLDQWSRILQSAAAQPLALCPDFPRIAARHEAWWNFALEGPPLFLASANPDPSRPISKNLRLLDQPEAWFAAQLEQVQRLQYVGDSIPALRVDFGPGLLGKLFGAKAEIGSDTTWLEAFICDDWSNAPDWTIQADDPWWQLLPRLTDLAAANAPGNYVVCTPNLGGSADLLLNLRGSAQLAMDVLDQPEKIAAAVQGIYPAWRQAFEFFHVRTFQHNAGLMHWVGLWSNRPYIVNECDFNYLIGKRPFQELFLEDIVRQSQTVGRAIFHLDGPGAAKHMDAILDTPAIQAIQYVTGAGNSALEKLPMLQKIQRQGRPLQVTVPASEVIALCRLLDPRGLAVIVEGALTPDELDDLYRTWRRDYE